jgi:hypothetical protein
LLYRNGQIADSAIHGGAIYPASIITDGSPSIQHSTGIYSIEWKKNGTYASLTPKFDVL